MPFAFNYRLMFFLIATLMVSQSSYAQFPLATTGNIVPNQSTCINGEEQLLDLSAFYEIESEFFVEYFIVKNDSEIADPLDRPLLGTTEFEYSGVNDSCNSIDIDCLEDSILLPVLFKQSELHEFTSNPILQGLFGASEGESLQEFVELFPNLTAIPIPDPLTINTVLSVLTSPTLSSILGFTPTFVLSPNYSAPEPSFDFSACSLDFESTSISDFEIESVYWDFGNGTHSEEFVPGPILYESPGTYDVSLVICNGIGCDSITQTIDVPPISISIPNEAEVGEAIDFSFESDLYTDQSWVFGDGAVSLEQSTQHTYSEPGFYTVELFLTNDSMVDCTLDYSETIEVSAQVGIGETTTEALVITPNPAIDLANLEIPESFQTGSVSVLSLCGRAVCAESKISGKSYQLDTSKFGSGIYLVHLVSEQGARLSTKLLVN